MGALDADERRRVLSATVTVPEHTVGREFVAETVVLNLDSGQYFGLAGAAGPMLDALGHSSTVAAALALLSKRYDVPAERLEQDLVMLCLALEKRGLIVISRADGP